MNDWVPSQSEWITAGYTAYRKRIKKKHSKALFHNWVRKSFLKQNVDINMACNGLKMIQELFWQVEVLKDWVFELTRLHAVRDGQGMQERRFVVERFQKLEGFSDAVKRVLIVDERSGSEEEVSGLHRQKVREAGLAPSSKRARVSSIHAVRNVRKTKRKSRGARKK